MGFLKPFVGIAFPPPDLHALCTNVRLHVRQVRAVVIASTYKRASELLRESRVDVRLTPRRMNTYWNVSHNRLHEEFAMEGEAVYLCKHEPSMAAPSREDYVKVWPKVE